MNSPTPGNWRYVRDVARVLSDAPTYRQDDTAIPVADLSLEDEAVASLCAGFKSLEEMHANGRLMAASKALLAACEMVLDSPGLTAWANDVIRGAVALARGDTIAKAEGDAS